MQAGFPRPSRWDPICISLAEQPCRHASEATSLHWSGECVSKSVLSTKSFHNLKRATNKLTSSNFQSLDCNQWTAHKHKHTFFAHQAHTDTVSMKRVQVKLEMHASPMVGKKILGTSWYSYMFKKEGRLNKLDQHFSAGWLPPTFPVRPYLH